MYQEIKISDRVKRSSQQSEKIEIYNGYAEKFGDIQVSIAEIKTEIKNIKR